MALLPPSDLANLTFIANALLVGLLTWWLAQAYVSIVHRPLSLMRKLRAQGVPGRPLVPLLGTLPEFFKSEAARDKDPALAATTDGLHFIRDMAAEYGKVFTYFLGPTLIVLCSDPDIIRQVYGTHNAAMPKQAITKRMLRILGDGLVVSEGDKWQKQRHLVNPLFTMKEIKRIYPMVAQSVLQSVHHLVGTVREAGGAPLPMHKILPEITVKVFGDTMFGSDLHGVGEGELSRALDAVAQHFPEAVMSGLVNEMLPPVAYIPYPRNVRVWGTHRTFTAFVKKMVRHRRSKSTHTPASHSVTGNGTTPQSTQDSPTDLLQLLVDASQLGDSSKTDAMSEQQLTDECVNMIFAGYDTIAVTLTWAMWLLSEHPEWQERAREEAQAVLKDKGPEERCHSFEELSELRTVSWIIQETLRLYPTVPLLGRTVAVDTQVSDSLTLPAGCDFATYVPALHRSKEYWGDDADQFKPDRFKDGVGKATKHPGAYLPFSTGPRVCVGQNFAMAESKLLLAALLCHFKWVAAPDYVHHPVTFATMKPKAGMPIIMTQLQ